MAQLFVPDSSYAWSILNLEGDRYRLSRAHPTQSVGRAVQPESTASLVVADRGGRLSRKGVLLLSRSRAHRGVEALSARSDWVVLAGRDARLRLNGVPVALGLAALRHRDELCFDGGTPLYFSTERVVSLETYEASDSPRCPRCTLGIEAGDGYVRCPGCGVLHHQCQARECWTYTESCALCDQSSDLAAGLRWSPDLL
jgi:hypothetical protein